MNAEIHKQLCRLESSLNYALEHIQDSYYTGSENFEGHKSELKRHIQDAKRAFDWLDNNTTITEPA